MMNAKVQKNTSELIILLNTAINNIRMYPPTSNAVIQTVDRIHSALDTIMETTDYIEYAASEKTPLVMGVPLLDAYKKKVPITNFFNIMTNISLRSLTIEKGISKREIVSFIDLFSQTNQEISASGGVRQMLTEQNVTHIIANEKTYVEMDSEHRLTEMDISEEEIARFILEDQPIPGKMLPQVRAMAAEDEWICTVFQQCVELMINEPAICPLEDAALTLQRIIPLLIGLSEDDKSYLPNVFLNAVAAMGDPVLLTLWTHNMEPVFGLAFYKHFIEGLDDDTFIDLIARVSAMADSCSAGAGGEMVPRITKRQQVINLINNIKKIRTLYKPERVQKGKADAASRSRFIKRAEHLQSALNNLLRCQTVASPDLMMLNGLAKTVGNLLEKNKYSTIVTLFDGLKNMLLNKDGEVRINAAELLSQIDNRLAKADRVEERIQLSRQLTDWINVEDELSPIYLTVTEQLQKFCEKLITKDRARDAAHIIDIYQKIAAGELSKPENIQQICQAMLKNLASEELLDQMIKVKKRNVNGAAQEDIAGLAMLGVPAVKRLLDLLNDTSVRAERNRIVRVITEIGLPGAPAVVERLESGGPWFFIRNLILLLGRIGDVSHIEILEPYLKDPDVRVARESALAIQNIGGETAGKVLAENMHLVDDEVNGAIIPALGMLGNKDTVRHLDKLLDAKSFGKTKKTKNDLLIKLCGALGRLGGDEAVALLEKIYRSKRFMTNTYDPPVREAAKKAYKSIAGTSGSL